MATRPHSRVKAARRVLSPDDEWARDIRVRIVGDCHPWQRDGVFDPHELVSMRVGRGGAKTTTMRARAIVKLVTLKRQRIGYAATSKEQARDLMWEPLKKACEAYGISKDFHFLDAQMQATCLRTGSIYKLRGVEDKRDAEKFRGFPQAEFQIDEAGSFPPELLRYLIEDCVQPRIGEAFSLRFLDELGERVHIGEAEDDRGGCIVMGSTPPAALIGLFYEATKPSGDKHRPYSERSERDAEWSSHSWTLADVVGLPNADRFPALQALWRKALKRKADKGWSDDHPVWCREYLGQWAADFTTTVFKFTPGKNLWRPTGDRRLDGMPLLHACIEALPGDVGPFRYVVTMDNGGTRDPFACNAFAFAPADPQRRLFHVFCMEKMLHGVRPVAELLVGPESVARVLSGGRIEPYGGLFGVFGHPDGLEFDADPAVIDELKNTYGIACSKADRRADYKFGAIEMVNGDLLDERIKVIEKSPLHSQCVELQWKADEHGRLKEHPGQANHCTDCLIYAHRLVSVLYDSGVVAREATTKDAGYQDPMGLDPFTAEREEYAGSAGLLADVDIAEDWGGI